LTRRRWGGRVNGALRRTLERAGHHVTHCRTAADALAERAEGGPLVLAIDDARFYAS